MRFRRSMRYTQPRIYKYIPVIVTFAVCALLAFFLATVWTKAEKSDSEQAVPAPAAETVNEAAKPEDLDEIPLVEDEFEVEEEIVEEAVEEKVQETSFEFTGKSVPESARVDSTYFDDAVFIGDSITDGIKAYGLMSNTTVLANKGLNPSTMLTAAKIKTENGYVTVLDALKMVQPAPKKIYIMQGGNGIAWFEKDTFINLYGELIDNVRRICPDSIIYVQSILPVTPSYSDADNGITNEKINEYNNAIADLAQKKNVYFLNVASALKDENGALPEEASPTDGMHFGPTYYTKWFDYLKTHTVQSKNEGGNGDISND